MYDVDRGARIPVDLDCDFALTRWDDEIGDVEYLLDEGTPAGVHEIEVDGQMYRVTLSVELLGAPKGEG